jgi:hypothetical protein
MLAAAVANLKRLLAVCGNRLHPHPSPSLHQQGLLLSPNPLHPLPSSGFGFQATTLQRNNTENLKQIFPEK